MPQDAHDVFYSVHLPIPLHPTINYFCYILSPASTSSYFRTADPFSQNRLRKGGFVYRGKTLRNRMEHRPEINGGSTSAPACHSLSSGPPYALLPETAPRITPVIRIFLERGCSHAIRSHPAVAEQYFLLTPTLRKRKLLSPPSARRGRTGLSGTVRRGRPACPEFIDRTQSQAGSAHH
jgi:hypothetical protein